MEPALMTTPPSHPGILAFNGIRPRIHPSVFVAHTAVVTGDVEIGEGASIWFSAAIRGDDNFVRIGAGTNVQDGAVIHVLLDAHPTVIGDGVTIGHGAILHGCTVQDRAMIGIGAVILDGAVVEEGAVVAAGAVVSPGKRVGKGEMWAGCPARMLRPVKEGERDFVAFNRTHYARLAAQYLNPRTDAP